MQTERFMRNITITFSKEDEKIIKDNMNNFGNDLPEDSLITKQMIAEALYKCLTAIHDIMDGKLDIEPYLPWKKDGTLNEDVPIVIIDTNIYFNLPNTHILCKFKLQLMPEVMTPAINSSTHTDEWYLFVDIFPVMPETYDPVIAKDGTLQPFKIHKKPVLPYDSLKHGGLYLDNHGTQWLIMRNITLKQHSIVKKKDQVSEHDCQIMNKDVAIMVEPFVFNAIMSNEIGYDSAGKIICTLTQFDNPLTIMYGLTEFDPKDLKLIQSLGDFALKEDHQWTPFSSQTDPNAVKDCSVEQQYLMKVG